MLNEDVVQFEQIKFTDACDGTDGYEEMVVKNASKVKVGEAGR